MPEVRTAERAGSERQASEDYVRVLRNAVLLLDGATSPRPELPSGGWYAGVLSSALAGWLGAHPAAELGWILARSIEQVRDEYALRPDAAPSSTVAMLRWDSARVDALVLGDSPVIVFGEFGTSVLADSRLHTLRTSGELRTEAAVRRSRNVDGGFWIAEADPTAAAYAYRAQWARSELDSAIMCSDGVSAGVEEYGLFDWDTLRDLARTHGPQAVLDAIRAAEDTDPARRRWPRPKRHDDQAIAVLDFTQEARDHP